MRIKSEFNKIGTIIKKTSNGLSLVADENGKEVRVAGGNVGDIVVKNAANNILIIKKEAWSKMPATKSEAEALSIAQNMGTAALAEKLIALEKRIEVLEKASKKAVKNEPPQIL